MEDKIPFAQAEETNLDFSHVITLLLTIITIVLGILLWRKYSAPPIENHQSDDCEEETDEASENEADMPEPEVEKTGENSGDENRTDDGLDKTDDTDNVEKREKPHRETTDLNEEDVSDVGEEGEETDMPMVCPFMSILAEAKEKEKLKNAEGPKIESNDKWRLDKSEIPQGADIARDIDPVDYCGHIQAKVKQAQSQATKKLVEQELTKEQLDDEKALQQQQMEAIFKLLQEQEEKFGIRSMEDVQSQMKLYM